MTRSWLKDIAKRSIIEGIPIRIKNTFNPKASGTLITNELDQNGKTVQGLTSITNVVLVNLKGPGMVGVPSMSQRLFKCFAEENINILGSIMTIEDILETNKLVNKL